MKVCAALASTHNACMCMCAAGAPQSSTGFMGMLGGVGAAAHKGAPDKAAEMLSMQQSPTAEKVCASRVVRSEVPHTGVTKLRGKLSGCSI